MNWLDRILIRLLLRKRPSYNRIIKIDGRNISVNIEEYIPAKQMLTMLMSKTTEQDLENFSKKIGARISKDIEEGVREGLYAPLKEGASAGRPTPKNLVFDARWLREEGLKPKK